MTHKIRLFSASALIFIEILVIYSNHWHNGFHDDDWHTITSNTYIQNLSNIPLFFEDVRTFSVESPNRSYRPVVTTTLAIDYALAQQFSGNGLTVFWYHLSTFIFFLIQGFLLFFFFRKILESVQQSPNRTPENANRVSSFSCDWIAVLAASLYMLHPAEAQTINYIIARSDSLSTFFLLLGFVIYQYFPKSRRFYLYLIPVVIGCLAKPTALMFAPILLVYIILFEQKSSLVNWKWFRFDTIKSAILPSFALVIVLYFFSQHKEAGYFVAGGGSLFNYLITQPFVYLHYVTNFILPLHFSAEWDWQPFESVTDLRCLLGLAFLAAMIWAVIYSSKFGKWRPVSFGIAWFLFALVPTTFVPLKDVLNDHRVFFPYIGLSLAFVWTIYLVLWPYLKRVPIPALITILAAILCVFGYLTYERNEVWRTDESLWKEVTIQSPKYGRGEMIYAQQFMARHSYDTAIYYFTLATQTMPAYYMLYVNLGIACGEKGDLDGAEQNFQKAFQIAPDNPDIYFYYASYLSRHNRINEAIGSLYSCITLSENNLDARHDLMALLLLQHRTDELKTVAVRTIQIVPNDSDATKYLTMMQNGKIPPQQVPTTADGFLILFLYDYQAGEYEKGIEAAKSAIKLNPNSADAYNDLCCAYNKLGRFAEGKEAGEEALRLQPDYKLARNNLDISIQGLNGKMGLNGK